MFLPDAEMVDVNPQNQSSDADCDLGAAEFPLSSNGFQFNPTLSTDGKRIAFSCAASNLPPYTGFLSMDVFVRTYAGAPPLLSIPIPVLGGMGLGLLGLLCMAGGVIASRFQSGASGGYPGAGWISSWCASIWAPSGRKPR